LNQIQSTSLNFKEVILTDSGINITFYYRPIFRVIQTLLQRPGITDHFVLTGGLRKEKVCWSSFETFWSSIIINILIIF
jgi:hypothetical protein